jgi:hypothetical protein
MGRAALALLLLVSLGGGAAACGRYGAPVRAEEYQQADRDKARAKKEHDAKTTPQERNDPIPEAP